MIDKLIDDIKSEIATTLSENPNAPELDVTKEIVEGFLLGEDESVKRKIRRRFKLDA